MGLFNGSDPVTEAKLRGSQAKDTMRPGVVRYEDGSEQGVPTPARGKWRVNEFEDGSAELMTPDGQSIPLPAHPVRSGGGMMGGMGAGLRAGGRAVGGAVGANVDRMGLHPSGPHMDIGVDGSQEMLMPPGSPPVPPAAMDMLKAYFLQHQR